MRLFLAMSYPDAWGGPRLLAEALASHIKDDQMRLFLAMGYAGNELVQVARGLYGDEEGGRPVKQYLVPCSDF